MRGPRLVAIAVAVASLAGCAALNPRAPEETVKQRAQARWDALVKGDTQAAYGYMSPGSRAVTTHEAFRNSLNLGFWKTAVVDKVECASDRSCDAIATIEYEHMGRRTKTPLRESWVRDGSQWWYLQK